MKASETFKKIRKMAGLNQVEMALYVGCQQAAISKFERGEACPSFQTAQRYIKLAKSKKIKVTLNDIFDDEE